MKNSIIIIIILLSSYSFSQGNKNISVEGTEGNLLFIGFQNNIKFIVPNYDHKNLAIISKDSCAYVEKLDNNGNYKIIVKKSGECIVNIYYNKHQLIGEYKFNKVYIPMPVAKIAGKYNGNIKKSLLIAEQGIAVSYGDYAFDVNVVSFTMNSIFNGEQISKSSKNNRFTPAMIEIVKKARVGDVFTFSNIRVEGLGSNRKVNNITLIVQ